MGEFRSFEHNSKLFEQSLLNLGEFRSFAVGDDVKCFCLSCTELKERMGTDSKLNGAVQSMFAESVLQKVLALNAKCDVVQYAAVLSLLQVGRACRNERCSGGFS